MEVNPTGSAGASKSSIAGATLADNFDTFLKLLTTELENQDPLEPLSSKEFTDQLVGFTGVEQAIATNRNLENLLDLVLAQQSGNLVNYLGKTAEVAGDAAGLLDGQAAWHYDLEANAAATQILVFDQNDKPVYVAQGASNAGGHDFVWDGRDNNGNALPDGVYRLSVAALDGDGKAIGSAITTRGVVSKVETIDGQNFLTVGGAKVPLSNVLSVSVAEAT